ncbi:MAG: HAD family phosphatase [Hyphomicrobiales bacterium]|nr:HAD family phosphatase [Hyphomicrobiales bacterium]
MNEIRHIVFDIGKVLIHYDPELPYRRLIPNDEKRRRFFTEICTPEWNIEQDRGRSWEEAEALLIADHPDEAENIRGFRLNWHEMVPHAYEGSVAIMEALVEQGHDVTMLTNFASDTFVEARERYTFLQKPRGVTVSGDIRAIKPDRAIFDHHISAFGLEPEATLFIDDSAPNIEGARAAGWNAVLFTDAETLRKDLARYGIEV